MNISCPHCHVPMRCVSAPAKTGYLISLDQCPCCGGIWCDRWEVYPITAAGAQALDPVDREALLRPATSSMGEPCECPRCRARLRRFSDPTIGADACIARCPNCEGLWFNHGELRQFKARMDSPLIAGAAASGGAVHDAELDRVCQQLGPAAVPPTVSNLSAAFEPAETEASTSSVGDLRAQLARDAAWIGVRALLRLVLHL